MLHASLLFMIHCVNSLSETELCTAETELLREEFKIRSKRRRRTKNKEINEEEVILLVKSSR